MHNSLLLPSSSRLECNRAMTIWLIPRRRAETETECETKSLKVLPDALDGMDVSCAFQPIGGLQRGNVAKQSPARLRTRNVVYCLIVSQDDARL
jgi:hypothetical protein